MKTITVKRYKNSNIPTIMDIFNAHPCINWEVNKAVNTGQKENVIFSFFDPVSYSQAKRILSII
jgi:hypothetical protein